MKTTGTMSRRDLLKYSLGAGAGVAVGSIWPSRVEAARGSAGESFTFVHYTDVHVQPELNAARGYAQAIYHMNRHRADFALSGGDLVFDTLGADVERRDRLWKLYTSLGREFDMPVHEVMGNHDNFALHNKLISPDHAGYGKQMYLEQLGLERTYGSFDHKGWHFVVLDSILPKDGGGWEPRLDAQQMQWLKDDLAAAGGRPAVVTLHVPILTVFAQVVQGPGAATDATTVMLDGKELRELFEASNVKLVLQGHLHVREQCEYNGVHYITSGALSGSWWNGPRLGHPEGYAVIQVDGDGFEWSYHTFDWVAKKQAHFSEDERELLKRMYAEREVWGLV